MLATAAPPGAPPPGGDDWLHEVKWDGMRLLVEVRDGRLRAFSRTEADVTVSFPELAGLTAAGADLLLDGEVVAFDEGRPSLRGARRADARAGPAPGARARRGAAGAGWWCSTCCGCTASSLLGRTFDDRRATLERLEPPEGPWQVPGVFADGPGLLEATRAQGLEGIVSKRRGSLYHPGRRSRDWVKKPHRSTQSLPGRRLAPADRHPLAARRPAARRAGRRGAAVRRPGRQRHRRQARRGARRGARTVAAQRLPVRRRRPARRRRRQRLGRAARRGRDQPPRARRPGTAAPARRARAAARRPHGGGAR
nr:hypothetical protein [Angustibacter aerolatus]